MSPAHQLDAERRAFGNSVPHARVETDPLYGLIQERLRKRGVLAHTLHWPEIDLAIRDAVDEWRKTGRQEDPKTG
jgi:hypothetical protein